MCQVNLGHLEYLWGNNFRKQELYSDLISLLQMEGQGKEQTREQSKEQSKEQSREQSKEQSREQSREQSKEQGKEQSREQSKEQSNDEIKKTRHLDCGSELLARTR